MNEGKKKGGKVKAQMIDTYQNHTKHTPVIIISVGEKDCDCTICCSTSSIVTLDE